MPLSIPSSNKSLAKADIRKSLFDHTLFNFSNDLSMISRSMPGVITEDSHLLKIIS